MLPAGGSREEWSAELRPVHDPHAGQGAEGGRLEAWGPPQEIPLAL